MKFTRAALCKTINAILIAQCLVAQWYVYGEQYQDALITTGWIIETGAIKWYVITAIEEGLGEGSTYDKNTLP